MMAKRAESKEKYQQQDREYFQPKSGGGLLSLALELLGAIAIRLVQRHFKSWSSTLIVKLKNPPGSKLSNGSLPGKIAPKDYSDLSEQPYQKGIVALFKNTASEWIQDKCPQLGAALVVPPKKWTRKSV